MVKKGREYDQFIAHENPSPKSGRSFSPIQNGTHLRTGLNVEPHRSNCARQND